MDRDDVQDLSLATLKAAFTILLPGFAGPVNSVLDIVPAISGASSDRSEQRRIARILEDLQDLSADHYDEYRLFRIEGVAAGASVPG